MMQEKQTRAVEMPGARSEVGRRNLPGAEQGVSNITAKRDTPCQKVDHLMEAVVEKENMRRAYKRVVGNKGASGIDNMSVDALMPYLQANWARIKEALLDGNYQPQAILRVEIPKPGGGKRQLGIPTVVDRLIQQAMHQVLVRIFDPEFCENSYGFRPGRSAHQAVKQAQSYVASGKRWVVDLDIEKFFDRVNHDILMSLIARKIKDKRLLLLIRRYLQSGVMVGGVVSPTREGTPQGGPMSPFLSNILLDELDKELERRGHSFCRYADDCNIYLQSRRAGERVLNTISRFLEKRLRLKLNKEKSKVSRPWRSSFLGYRMTVDRNPKLKPSPDSIRRFRSKLKELFRKGRGRNIRKVIEEMNPQIRGWINYYSLSGTKQIFEDMDSWIRHRYRCMIWRQWKRPRTRRKKLISLGLSEERASKSAYNGRGPWWNSGASHMNQVLPKSTFEKYGLISLLDQILVFQCQS